MNRRSFAAAMGATLLAIPSCAQTVSPSLSRRMAICILSSPNDFQQTEKHPAASISVGTTVDRGWQRPATFVLIYRDHQTTNGTMLMLTTKKAGADLNVNVQNVADMTRKGSTFDFTDEAPLGGIWTKSRFIRAAHKIKAQGFLKYPVADLKSKPANLNCSYDLSSF